MLAHLLAIALAAAHTQSVVARVGPEIITAGEVTEHAHSARLPTDTALDNLVKEALLAIAARAEGLANTPEVRARIDAEKQRLAVERLLDIEVTSRAKVSDAEVEEAFHARADRVRLSMVVRATEPEAHDVLARIRNGAALIDEAKQSIDPIGRSKSGVLGWFSRNELSPKLAREAFSVPLGEASGPVRLEKGFAVFVVHERVLGTDAAFRRDAAEIKRTLLNGRREDRAAHLLRMLRHRDGAAVPDTELLAREAERRRLDHDPEVVRALRRSERSILAQAYITHVAAAIDPPSNAEVRAAYAARPDQFWIPQRRICDMLLANSEQDAEKLRARLVAGERLEDLARNGADAGARSASVGKPIEVTDPELESMASDKSDQHILAWTIRKTPPGVWTKTEANGHWHVIRCGAPEPAHQRPLAEVKPELERAIRDQHIAAELDERLADLRRVTPPRIDAQALHASEGR